MTFYRWLSYKSNFDKTLTFFFLEFYKSRIVEFFGCTSNHFQLSSATIKDIFPKGEGLLKCKKTQKTRVVLTISICIKVPVLGTIDVDIKAMLGHLVPVMDSTFKYKLKAFVLEIPGYLLWCNCIQALRITSFACRSISKHT